jgi:hypothetical protein
LWTVFNALQLEAPTIVEPNLSHVCGMHDPVPFQIRNDFSFPMASSVRFKYAAKGSRPAIDLIWYDGGIRPAIPVELIEDNKELPAEGMMFVGDKGKILAGFNVDDPQLISGKQAGGVQLPKRDQNDNSTKATDAYQEFIDACKSKKQYPGSFAEAEHLTEAVNLYAASLRSGKLLKYDAASMKITNAPDANKYLSREYRSGWDPASI